VPFAAAVMRPLASTVMFELEYEPGLTEVVDSAGAASDRMNVDAEPLMAAEPIVAVGFEGEAAAPFAAAVRRPC
jgi:hypothetical protein